jgi:hypothetical protein
VTHGNREIPSGRFTSRALTWWNSEIRNSTTFFSIPPSESGSFRLLFAGSMAVHRIRMITLLCQQTKKRHSDD